MLNCIRILNLYSYALRAHILLWMGGLEAARAARSDNDDASERELLCSVYLCSIVQEYSSRYDTSTSSTDGDASHKKTSQRKLNRCTCCVLCTVFINQEEGDPLAGLQREPLGPESLCFKYPAVKKKQLERRAASESGAARRSSVPTRARHTIRTLSSMHPLSLSALHSASRIHYIYCTVILFECYP